jgi:threonine synthase
MQPMQARTVADSISAGLPRDRIKALAAVRESGGAYVVVPDEQILAAIPALARATGVFAEPAGAAVYAGLLRAVADGLVARHERVVLLVTGSGLKDIAAARSGLDEPLVVDADLAAVKRAIARLGIGSESSCA